MEEKKGFFAEFKEFISRGNVIDMAVGVIIGSAFTTIVNSLVNDIVMPFLSMLTGGINFLDLKIVLREATETTAESAILYGKFIQNIINFLLIAFVVFIMVRTINKLRNMKKKEEEAAAAAAAAAAAEPAPEPEPEPEPQPSEEVLLLREIRDALKDK